MEPKTRNRGLMIGGGIALMLLLLVCGPLEGIFGTNAEQKTPDVAAGPPAGHLDAALAGVAAAGAAAGAAIGESDIAGIIEGRDTAAGEFDGAYGEGLDAGQGTGTGTGTGAGATAGGTGAAISAGAGATGVAIASATAGSGSGSGAGLGASAGAGATGSSAAGAAKATAGSVRGRLPSVSAGVPIDSLPSVSSGPTFPADPVGPSAADAAAAAARSFDVAAAGISTSGIGAAGRVVERFAPPVESGPVAERFSPSGFNPSVLRPCDSPGAGCSNVAGVGITPINPGIGSLPPRGRGGVNTSER